MNYDFDETKIDNIHKSWQMRAGWDNTHSDPKVKIAHGVGSAPNRATQPYTIEKKGPSAFTLLSKVAWLHELLCP